VAVHLRNYTHSIFRQNKRCALSASLCYYDGVKNGSLIAIGGAYVDINAPDFPLGEHGLSLESEVVGQAYALEPGGSAVNFARLCSALHIPTTFVGKVGKDALGNILADLLTQSQVEPDLIVAEDVSTNVSFNMVNAAGESIMAVVGTANQALTSDEVHAKVSARMAGSAYLFIGGCFKLKKLMPAFLQLAREAKASGVKVVLDHARLNDGVTENDKETVRQLALAADVYLPSADEFRALWGVATIEAGLMHLRQKNYQGTLVVKDGERGAVTIVDGNVLRVPAFAVKPLHTVGAGDSFNAGFIASQYKGETLMSSIAFGCATAALKISQPVLPTYDRVVAFLADNSTDVSRPIHPAHS